jgi:hypothetical protein
MAALVAGLVNGLGFSEGDAGRVGSLNIYGAALGASPPSRSSRACAGGRSRPVRSLR